jgi:hypothetical protein
MLNGRCEVPTHRDVQIAGKRAPWGAPVRVDMRTSAKIAPIATADATADMASSTEIEGPAVERALRAGTSRPIELHSVIENQRRPVYLMGWGRWKRIGAYNNSIVNEKTNGTKVGVIVKPKRADTADAEIWNAFG